MEHVLVTGGAGFIGTNLCEFLLSTTRYKVTCLDNLVSGSMDNVDMLKSKYSNFNFVLGDVINPFKFDVDAIYHLACPASPSPDNKRSYLKRPIDTVLTNVLGMKNALDLACELKIPILFSSTSEIYGNAIEHPQNENYLGNVSSIGIRSCYDEGKRCAEALCMAYLREKDVDIKIIRIFNTYGPQMANDGRAVPNFILQALNDKPLTIYGSGNQTRSLCYVSDTIKGMFRVMTSDKSKGEVFNIGNPHEITVNQLAGTVARICDSKSEVIHVEETKEDPQQRRPDISKINNLLGWSPEVDLDEGLNETIKWFKENKERLNDS